MKERKKDNYPYMCVCVFVYATHTKNLARCERKRVDI